MNQNQSRRFNAEIFDEALRLLLPQRTGLNIFSSATISTKSGQPYYTDSMKWATNHDWFAVLPDKQLIVHICVHEFEYAEGVYHSYATISIHLTHDGADYMCFGPRRDQALGVRSASVRYVLSPGKNWRSCGSNCQSANFFHWSWEWSFPATEIFADAIVSAVYRLVNGIPLDIILTGKFQRLQVTSFVPNSFPECAPEFWKQMDGAALDRLADHTFGGDYSVKAGISMPRSSDVHSWLKSCGMIHE